MTRARPLAPRFALVALVLAITFALTAPPGRAAPPQPTQPAQSAQPEPTIRLVSQSGWVAPSGQFRLQLDVGPLAPGSEVTATLYRAVKTRTALDQTGRGERLGPPDHAVTVPLVANTTTPGGRPVIDLGYPIVPSGADPALGFSIAEAGVYPLQISIADSAGKTQGRLITHLIRLPTQSYTRAPLTIALVLPVGAPVAHRPDGSVVLPDDQTAALEALTTTLGRYPSVPVSVAPTPETLDALAGTAAGPRITTSLSAKSLQVMTGPYVPVASGSWIEQGLTDRYRQELAAGADTLRSVLGIDPDHETVLVDDHTTPAVLSLLAAAGTTQAVVTRPRLEATSSRPEPTTLTQTFSLLGAGGEQLRSVTTDPALSDRLTASIDPVLDAHEILADLTLTALEPPSQPCVAEATTTSRCSRGVAVQLPAAAASAQPALEVLLAALADRDGTAGAAGAATDTAGAGKPVMSPMTVASLIGVVDEASATSTGPTRAPVERQLTAIPTTPLGSYPARLEAVAGQVGGFRSMVVSDDPIGLEVAASLDRVVLSSGAVSLDENARLAQLDGAAATVHAQTDRITSPQQQIVTLTSGEGLIPLNIENALDYPVRVRLVLTSSKLEFPDGNEQIVDLAAGSPTRVEVRVRARASGAFPLEVGLQSPDSTLAITSTRFQVRSTAVSEIGLVLTVAAGLFLLLWWARNFRKTRRDRKLIVSTHPVLRGGGAASGPGPI